MFGALRWLAYPALLLLTGFGAKRCDALGFGGARSIVLSLAAVAGAALILIVSGALGEYVAGGLKPLIDETASPRLQQLILALPAVKELRDPPATAILALALVIVFLHGLLELSIGLQAVVAQLTSNKEAYYDQLEKKQK
eukprot:TRINITY_DN17332_c0_g1_i1.p1 TRINITY_DN17332_c0_g1~~TRINITY_DN17332_c0_g1_i1.p1  ORF type:complete len:140 (+),score=38.69 TRINITY_DN17332_c0_g1_i1:46-465(+)